MRTDCTSFYNGVPTVSLWKTTEKTRYFNPFGVYPPEELQVSIL